MAIPAHETASLLRLTVDEYHRMGEVGILKPSVRTELIDGEIVKMVPIGPGHAGAVNLLSNLMRDAVHGQAIVATQNPVILSPHWEPQPDIALLKPRDDWYTRAHATAGDILLLVEVADSSLLYDRKTKIPGYAEMGIPETWLADLSERTLTKYSQPAGKSYTEEMDCSTKLYRIRLPLESATTLDLSKMFG